MELGGSGLAYSINYERNLVKGSVGQILSSGGLTTNFGNYTAFPVEIHFLLGKHQHFLETGAGITNIFSLRNPINIDITPAPKTLQYENIYSGRVGYRYQSANGFLFRVAWVPIVEEKRVYSWAGLSIGTGF